MGYNTPIIEFVLKAHGNQKYAGMPYIVHLMLVARHFTDPKKQAIALLHDVLEDTDITYEDLAAKFGTDIADTVYILTHRGGEGYFDYIYRVKKNKLATEIKIADLTENLFISENEFSKESGSLSSRYEQALRVLEER